MQLPNPAPYWYHRSTSLIRNSAPPQGRHGTLAIVLLQGPTEGGVLMSQVPLYHTVEYAAFVASKFRELLDQICTTYDPELSRVIQVG